MLCPQHNRLLVSSLSSLVRSLCNGGSMQALANSHSYSTDSSSSNSNSGDTLAEFQQKVAALQDSQAEPNLQALINAAGNPSPASAASSSSGSGLNQPDHNSTAADAPSAPSSSSSSDASGSSRLFSAQYGYAVLGGVNPEASQQEAGAQQPKLHPTRDFRQGEMYEPTDLSPLSKEEAEAWLPRTRRGPRQQRIAAEDVKSQLDFKNINFLLNFVSASGRIKPRRQTGLKPIAQARVARTVKLARQMALLPYEMRVGDGGEGDVWRRMRDVKAAQMDVQREGKAAQQQRQ